MRPGRRITCTLQDTAIPPTPQDVQPITAPGILVFPPGAYPLKPFDQLELYWGLWTMPTGASYVDITMFAFRGWIFDPTAPTFRDPGSMDLQPSPANTDMYLETFLQLDTTSGLEIPFQARIRKTAADGSVSAGAGPTNYRTGTRHSFPIEEDMIGFLIQSDGMSGTGSMSLFGVLGSE